MKSILKHSRIALAALLAVGLHSAAHAAAPVPASPVLTNSVGWDCVFKGSAAELGIMFLTFNPDNTFSGVLTSSRVAVPKFKTPSNVRSGTPSDRNPSSNTVVQVSVTNIYGFGPFTGQWFYDVKGYTVGSFSYVVYSGSSTNVNGVSFKAKIAPNRRLTASYSSSIGGNGALVGVPITTNLPSLSGTWSGDELNGPLTSSEAFNLSPSSPVAPSTATYPGLYDVVGFGPGYDLTGHCMVSSLKWIGFGDFRDVTLPAPNAIRRATVGAFINKKGLLGGVTKGLADGGTNVLSYNAFWVSP